METTPHGYINLRKCFRRCRFWLLLFRKVVLVAIVSRIIKAFPLNYFVPPLPPHFLCFKSWEVSVAFPLARVQTDRVQTESTPGCRMVTGWLSSLTSFIIKPLLLCILSHLLDSSRSTDIDPPHFFIRLVESN